MLLDILKRLISFLSGKRVTHVFSVWSLACLMGVCLTLFCKFIFFLFLEITQNCSQGMKGNYGFTREVFCLSLYEGWMMKRRTLIKLPIISEESKKTQTTKHLSLGILGQIHTAVLFRLK